MSSAALRSFFVTSARRVFLFGTIAATAGGYFRNNDRTHTRPRQTRARREDRRDGVANRTIIIAFTPSFCRDAPCNLSQIIALDVKSVTFQADLTRPNFIIPYGRRIGLPNTNYQFHSIPLESLNNFEIIMLHHRRCDLKCIERQAIICVTRFIKFPDCKKERLTPFSQEFLCICYLLIACFVYRYFSRRIFTSRAIYFLSLITDSRYKLEMLYYDV